MHLQLAYAVCLAAGMHERCVPKLSVGILAGQLITLLAQTDMSDHPEVIGV